MTLSKEQLKEARQFCKANGINPKEVSKTLGWGFWEEECNSTLEGYLNWLKNNNCDGSMLLESLKEGLRKSPVQKMYREVKENTFG